MYKYTIELRGVYRIITLNADRERIDDGWLYFEIAESTAIGTTYQIIAAYDLNNVTIWNNETLAEKVKEKYEN